MKPLLVVQENHITRLSAPLAQAWRDRGGEVWPYMFGEKFRFPNPPHEFLKYFPIMVYGSVGFVELCRRHPALASWTWCDGLSFNTTSMAHEFHAYDLLNNPYACRIRDLNEELYTDRYHFRPTKKHKAFNGGVYTIGELKSMGLDPQLEVAWSKIQDIIAEFRFWLIGDKPVACSQYRAFGRSETTTKGFFVEAAMIEIKGILDRCPRPSHEFNRVLDLALVSKTNDNPYYPYSWKIIEQNYFNSSGWYAVDPGVIVDKYLEFYSTKGLINS